MFLLCLYAPSCVLNSKFISKLNNFHCTQNLSAVVSKISFSDSYLLSPFSKTYSRPSTSQRTRIWFSKRRNSNFNSKTFIFLLHLSHVIISQILPNLSFTFFFFVCFNRIASQIAPTDWIRLCSKEEAYRLLVWCVPPHANTPFWMMCSTRYLSRMAREAVISGRSVLIYYAEGPKTTRPRAAVIDGAQGQALCGGVAGEFIVRFGVDIEMVWANRRTHIVWPDLHIKD